MSDETKIKTEEDASVEQKEVIKKLTEEASDPVKPLLQAYNDEGEYDENLETLKTFEESVLEEAALFLGGKPRDGEGKQLYRNYHSLSDWIIMAIEGLFPQHCKTCNDTYTIKRGDTPRFRCVQCWGGSHDCAKMPTTIPAGFSWICSSCTEKNELERFVGEEAEFKSPLRSASSIQRKFSFSPSSPLIERVRKDKKENAKKLLEAKKKEGTEDLEVI